MKRITQDVFDRITLNASLQRLGVVELAKRLEISPLLVEGGLRATDSAAPDTCCVCKFPDDDTGVPHLQSPRIVAADPEGTVSADDLDSTGPTDGGTHW